MKLCVYYGSITNITCFNVDKKKSDKLRATLHNFLLYSCWCNA